MMRSDQLISPEWSELYMYPSDYSNLRIVSLKQKAVEQVAEDVYGGDVDSKITNKIRDHGCPPIRQYIQKLDEGYEVALDVDCIDQHATSKALSLICSIDLDELCQSSKIEFGKVHRYQLSDISWLNLH